MKSFLNALGCACETSRMNLGAFGAFGADEFESQYDWSKVSFDPPVCPDDNVFCRLGLANTPSKKAQNALGKLFRDKTSRYFSTKDNHLWDLILFNDPAQINQKLAYLVWDGNTDYTVTPQPIATVANLRAIKKALLADWRGDRIWYAYLYPKVRGPVSVNPATPENLAAGRAYKLGDGAVMTRSQVLNLLKRNSDVAMTPYKLGVHPKFDMEPNVWCGPGQSPGLDPLGKNGPPTGNCTIDRGPFRKTYSGFARFGDWNESTGEYDPEYWDPAFHVGEDKPVDYYDRQEEIAATSNEIRQMYSQDQLVDAFEGSEFDDRAGYYIDRGLNLAFDMAGNAIGLWDGKDVVSKSGRKVAPPTTGAVLPAVIGIAALLLLTKK